MKEPIAGQGSVMSTQVEGWCSPGYPPDVLSLFKYLLSCIHRVSELLLEEKRRVLGLGENEGTITSQRGPKPGQVMWMVDGRPFIIIHEFEHGADPEEFLAMRFRYDTLRPLDEMPSGLLYELGGVEIVATTRDMPTVRAKLFKGSNYRPVKMS